MASFNLTENMVTLKGDTATDYDVECVFSSADSAKISNLEPDQSVKAKGTVGEIVAGAIRIADCTFVN